VADNDAPRTPEQDALVEFGLSRFAEHGLDLPAIAIQFYDSVEPCGLHTGIYVHRTGSLHMCSTEKDIMLHELAHAWANHNLTDGRRAEFVALRGVRAWNDRELAWEDRGTEHAAEIIAWALLDEPNHVKWVETSSDGSATVTFRLLTIENSDIDSMIESFRLLTNQEPKFRASHKWKPGTGDSFSPEALRTGS
jgi:hypothetical protein